MERVTDIGWPPESAIWSIRLLGQFEVRSTSNEVVRLSTRKSGSLLALLALQMDREFSNEELQAVFWPDSDGDKQAQNLRRAIADLRSMLEHDMELGAVVKTRKGHVSLNSGAFATDAARFLLVSDAGLQTGDEDSLREAISLYTGPLLAQTEESWVQSFRLEFEERYAQVVEEFCEQRMKAGAHKEAVRTGRAAVVAAPMREDIHIALIRAYRGMGQEAEALRQFEDLERMLDENWGEAPSEKARAALELETHSIAFPKVDQDSDIRIERQEEGSEVSGGAVPLGSSFYVKRPADEQAKQCLARGEGVVLIQGPRQVGKSSLLARVLAHGRSSGILVAVNDFQTLGETQLSEEDLFYKTLAYSLASQLGIDFDLESEWQTWLGPNMNLDSVLGKLLTLAGGRVCWGFDEADALFGRPYMNNFFGLLRSWHNRRALDPDGPWGKLTLFLSYATEAHLFISDLNQSPFNVGLKIQLRDFGLGEIAELAGLHGITEESQITTVARITGGQPYLARRALAILSQGTDPTELETAFAQPDGPIGDHLHRIFESIRVDPNILSEVRNALAGRPLQDPNSRYRLIAAGVFALRPDQAVAFRVPAYETYLRAALG